MTNIVKIKNKIANFNKTITVPGDKSLSIRWVLFSSLAKGTSTAKNLLMSEKEKSMFCKDDIFICNTGNISTSKEKETAFPICVPGLASS